MRYAFTLAAVLSLFAVPAARADVAIVAGPPSQYVTPNVTMDQGEPLTFYSFDAQAHDVTATQKGPDGNPLFMTDLISLGESDFVRGSQYLTAGSYDFFCTLHANMHGTLTVTAAGTPQPRPGPGNPAPPDATKPGVAAKVRGARLKQVRRTGRLPVEVSVNEAAKVALKATTTVRGRKVTVARGAVEFRGAGTRRLEIKLSRAGKRALAGRSRAAVTVTATATDTAGNTGSARAARTLRR